MNSSYEIESYSKKFIISFLLKLFPKEKNIQNSFTFFSSLKSNFKFCVFMGYRVSHSTELGFLFNETSILAEIFHISFMLNNCHAQNRQTQYCEVHVNNQMLKSCVVYDQH